MFGGCLDVTYVGCVYLLIVLFISLFLLFVVAVCLFNVFRLVGSVGGYVCCLDCLLVVVLCLVIVCI